MQNSLLHAQAYQANSAGKLSSGSIASLRTVFAHKGVVLQTLIREEISSRRLGKVCVCARAHLCVFRVNVCMRVRMCVRNPLLTTE